MNLDSITLANLVSRFSNVTPASGGWTLAWNASNTQWEPVQLKTVGGQSLLDGGDIPVGSKQAFYVVDIAATMPVNTLSATTVNGVAVEGKKVLLTGQADTKLNGVYRVTAGVWSRVPEMSDTALLRYVFFFDKYANVFYKVRGTGPFVIGTDSLSITAFTFQSALTSGVTLKTVNGTPLLTSGDRVLGSGGGSNSVGNNTVSGTLTESNVTAALPAFMNADGTLRPALSTQLHSAAPVAYGTDVDTSSEITSGGTGHRYGKIFNVRLKTTGRDTYGRIMRAYRKDASTLYLQTGVLDADGVPTWYTEYPFPYSADYIVDIKAVGPDTIVILASSTALGGSFSGSMWVWTARVGADNTSYTTGYYNLGVNSGVFRGATLEDFCTDSLYSIPTNGNVYFLTAYLIDSTIRFYLLYMSNGQGNPILSDSATLASSSPTEVYGKNHFSFCRYAADKSLLVYRNGSGYQDTRVVSLSGETLTISSASSPSSEAIRSQHMTCVYASSTEPVFLSLYSTVSSTGSLKARLFQINGSTGAVTKDTGFTTMNTGYDLDEAHNIFGWTQSDYVASPASPGLACFIVRRYISTTTNTYVVPIEFNLAATYSMTLKTAIPITNSTTYDGLAQYDGPQAWTLPKKNGVTFYHFTTTGGNTFRSKITYAARTIPNNANLVGVFASAATVGSSATAVTFNGIYTATGDTFVPGTSYYIPTAGGALTTSSSGELVGVAISKRHLRIKDL